MGFRLILMPTASLAAGTKHGVLRYWALPFNVNEERLWFQNKWICNFTIRAINYISNQWQEHRWIQRHQDPPSVRHNDFLKPMIKFSEICKRLLCMAIFTNENHWRTTKGGGHTFQPSTPEAGAGGYLWVAASLIYRGSSRPARALGQDPLSTKKRESVKGVVSTVSWALPNSYALKQVTKADELIRTSVMVRMSQVLNRITTYPGLSFAIPSSPLCLN